MNNLFKNKVVAIVFIFCIFFFEIFNIYYLILKVKEKVEEEKVKSYIAVQVDKTEEAVEQKEDSTMKIVEEELDNNSVENSSLFDKITSLNKTISGYISEIENTYNSNIFNKEKFIEVFGKVQKIMGKDIIDNVAQSEIVVKDNNDLLQFINNEKEVDYCINSLKELNKTLEEKEILFLYVQAPFKVLRNYTILPAGYEDYTNENIDNLIDGINNEINYIDLRDEIENSDLNKKDLFYVTDHHWKIDTAFWAFTKIVKELNSNYNLGLDKQGIYTDINNYNSKIYKENFLGTQGERVSQYFVGLDDFNLITPKFNTNIKLTQILEGGILHEKKGDFNDSLIYDYMIESDDKYSTQSYAAYLGYGNTEKIIINNNADNDLKLLVVGDSFSRPFTAFMSLCFKETRTFDSQDGRGNINVYKYIDEYDPDIVLCMFNGSAVGNYAVYNFNK